MFSPASNFPRTVLLLGSGIALLGSVSCRKPIPSEKAEKPPEEIATELLSNRLADSPSTMLADQATSPVHWQPFSRATQELAGKANRLIFAVVAMPQQPAFIRVLKAINEDPVAVRDLNDRFVPMLIDADAARECALLAAVLCSDVRRPLDLPLFVWMTPQGHPVAWIPANQEAKNVHDLIESSSSTVSQIWRDNPTDTTTNSANDNVMRARRLGEFAKCPPASKQPAQDAVMSLRELATLYDAGSHSIDGCGALFPSGVIDLLAASLLVPGLPKDVASRCRDTTQGLSTDVASSAMIDPLEGGIFNSRLGSGWSLPLFSCDCQSQARATVALINAYRATGNRELLDRATAAISHTEKHFATEDGLFALGRQDNFAMDSWLWGMDDVEKALSPQELKVLVAVCDLRGLGNIPVESDPQREYFRRNSLAIRTSPESAAPGLGLSPAAARELFESSRKKLLKLRQERIGSNPNDPRPHAGSTLRMVSTYAAAFAATGEPGFRKKAIETLQRARATFAKGPALQNFPGTADALTSGRAFLYGLAIQAALDVNDITLDAEWVSWAEDLASTSGEYFMEGDGLREAAKGQSLFDLPLTDRAMLFDDSTVGLLSTAQARLAQHGRRTPVVFSSTVVPFPAMVVDRPILHTDLLLAALIRDCGPVVLISPGASPSLREAASRLPLRVITRRIATESDTVPANSVKIVFKDGRTMATSDSTALEKALSNPGLSQ